MCRALSRSLLAVVGVLAITSSASAGWWHHHHQVQPVYMYQAPAQYYAAPAAGQASQAPLLELMLARVLPALLDKIEVGGKTSIDGGGSIDVRPEIAELKSELQAFRREISERVENANSILTTQGKKIVELEEALDHVRKEVGPTGGIQMELETVKAAVKALDAETRNALLDKVSAQVFAKKGDIAKPTTDAAAIRKLLEDLFK